MKRTNWPSQRFGWKLEGGGLVKGNMIVVMVAVEKENVCNDGACENELEEEGKLEA